MAKFRKWPVVAVVSFYLIAGSSPTARPQGAPAQGTKYSKFIVSDVFKKIEYYTGSSYVAHEGELGGNITMAYHCLTKPKLFDMTHAHNFQEVLCFFGGNPLDITDFGAEVEIELGAEHEKHTITRTSCVSIPPNVPHCPLNIKRVDKPIIFLEISNSPTYGKPPAAAVAKPSGSR
jgi:hypothetical protein